MPDIRTASVASANEENLAAAVTTRSMTDELKACSSRPNGIRRGEKVPAAVGTVGDAFDLLDRGSLGSEGAGAWLGGASPTAVGTGLLTGELGGLLPEEQFECALGQPVCGGGGDLLEGAEIDIESRSVVAEGPPGDNLGPRSGEVMEFPEFLGCETWRRHALSCLVVASMRGWGFPIPPSIHRKADSKP
jgi:hypothetical protein